MNTTGMGLGMWLLWIIIIVAIALIFKLVMTPGPGAPGNTPSAMDTLKQRHARGEIDSEEFERMKKELQR